MSGIYTGAYSTTKYSPTYIPEKRIKELYIVISATHIDTYHYHGSWFEYTWDLILMDSKGNRINKQLDTWNEYHKLSGSTIEYDGNVFKACL